MLIFPIKFSIILQLPYIRVGGPGRQSGSAVRVSVRVSVRVDGPGLGPGRRSGLAVRVGGLGLGPGRRSGSRSGSAVRVGGPGWRSGSVVMNEMNGQNNEKKLYILNIN